MDHVEARLIELDTRLTEIAQTIRIVNQSAGCGAFAASTHRPQFSFVAELHDVRRFHSARALMASVGLVPARTPLAGNIGAAGFTRTGNALVRRLLVETAWHSQHRAGVGIALARRRTGQPARVIAMAEKAPQRLCRRVRRLAEHHKPAPKIALAIGHELAGFLWAALQPAPMSIN